MCYNPQPPPLTLRSPPPPTSAAWHASAACFCCCLLLLPLQPNRLTHTIRFLDLLPRRRRRAPGTSIRPALIESCAVVGNSWILSNSSFGAEIDGHEAVIRLNDAPVHGFEADIGRRLVYEHWVILHWILGVGCTVWALGTPPFKSRN